jgi:hypothetical protein
MLHKSKRFMNRLNSYRAYIDYIPVPCRCKLFQIKELISFHVVNNFSIIYDANTYKPSQTIKFL